MTLGITFSAKLVFFTRFGVPWGPKMEPKLLPKSTPNLKNRIWAPPRGSQEAPEVIWGTILGPFCDPSGALLGAFWDPNCWKELQKQHMVANSRR